jgi:hemerythrin superfamily protein
MEPRENEAEQVELEEQFMNRTGIMNNPKMGAELIKGAEELTRASDGDATDIAEMRADYLEDATPIGSEPLSAQENDGEGELSEASLGLPVLLDKLGERLAFERQGTRLYEAFLQKFEAVGAEEDGGPTAAELRHICDEEFEHFRLLQRTIVKLGGDATVQTPSADIVGVISKGATEIIVDPRTTIAQGLQALLTAELADNDGWQMLGQLAAQSGLDELEEQCRKALEAEQEHLEKVRQWLLSITLQDAEGGRDIATTPIEETEEEVQFATTQTKNRRPNKNKSDALELLKRDHEKVKELFEQADAADDDKGKRKIFKEIKKELETHTRIEENIFYPAMQEYAGLEDMVLEAIEEHKQVKKLLREIDKLGKTSDKFEPKLKVLQENVEHHAEEEEEGKMFPKIREVVDGDKLEELGNELEASKNKRQRKAS